MLKAAHRGEYQAKKERAQRDQVLTDHWVVMFDVYIVKVFLQVFEIRVLNSNQRDR